VREIACIADGAGRTDFGGQQDAYMTRANESGGNENRGTGLSEHRKSMSDEWQSPQVFNRGNAVVERQTGPSRDLKDLAAGPFIAARSAGEHQGGISPRSDRPAP
jgi:hypothetical protein